MIKPISPEQAKHEKQDVIPEAVIEVVNRLLRERYDGREAVLKQDEVHEEALALMRAGGAQVSRDEFFKRRWLDFEQLYRDEGWSVVFDKPGYNESYDAFWVFSKRK